MFAERLRELRKSHGLTQRQLADELGLAGSTVSMYEKGKRRPDTATLGKICRYFSVMSDSLLDEVPSPCEVERIISDLKERLLSADGLMFNGVPLTDEDVEKLTDAIIVSANVVLTRK